MLYDLLRPALFALDAETAHHLTLKSLATFERLGLIARKRQPECTRKVMGLEFPNPVGLAAGLDKNAEYIDALATLGFGFIEVGTVTPRPQPGNPRPRLFRIPEANAIVNRMGFNNHGVECLVDNVRETRWQGVLGINIGKNFDTPNERALDDYATCLRKVYALASYVTINISSPNTKGLRELQGARELETLLAGLSTERQSLADEHGRRVPLALKIAPDLDPEQVTAICDVAMKHGMDALIATNTTVSRDAVASLPHGRETGGVSGAPLTNRATEIVRGLVKALAGAIPVIAAGGIMSPEDAREKIAAGASLVQLYTGLVYRGPSLADKCVQALCNR